MLPLSTLFQQYAEVSDELRHLEERKEQLRRSIEEEMRRLRLETNREGSTHATLTTWFKLKPRRESVLGLLTAADMFPFASFTANRVKELLVPVYGRERLLPLFDIEKKSMLRIQVGKPARSAGPGHHQESSESQ